MGVKRAGDSGDTTLNSPGFKDPWDTTLNFPGYILKIGIRGVILRLAAHNAVDLTGESPIVGIDCLHT
jgi:hypothetical protein